jgi:alkaline phosphatase
VKFHAPARKFAFPDMHVYKARWFDNGLGEEASTDNPLSRAHSHNDYMQAAPFALAYQNQFGSVEADVHLRNDTLFVAHDSKDINADRTFDKLYLQQIAKQVAKNQGSIYKDKNRVITLLVDLKTTSGPTLRALVKTLAPYQDLLVPKGTVKVVVSNDTPAPDQFDQYPAYVFFDGRPGVSYTPSQAERLGMISQDFHRYSQWNGKGIPVEKDRKAIVEVIAQAHALDKPFRFWASPDNINAWKILMNLGVDYINTDHVAELGTFLSGRKNAEYKSTEFHQPYQPTYKNNDALGKVRNIILLIGDGMGLAQIYSGLTANRGELNLGRFLNIGFSKTASSDNYITDSAAGATAFATGKKTRNRAIGVDSNLVAVPSIIRQVKTSGRKAALISAGDITDATPAAFYAHRPERSMMDEIAMDYLKNPVDVLIGGGYNHFAKTNTADSLKARGFQVSDNWNDLPGMKAPFVLLDDKHVVSMLKGRGDFLKDSFQQAIQTLQSNPKGFFMMAEGAQVDYGGHANQVPYVVTEMLDFDKLVGEALRFADSNGETLVIVTADHETGGLTLLDGNLKTGYVDGQFSTNDHTGIMVPVFAYGPHSLDFRGIYENTEIYFKIAKVIGR